MEYILQNIVRRLYARIMNFVAVNGVLASILTFNATVPANLEMQIRNQIVKMDLTRFLKPAVLLEIMLLIMMSSVAHLINVNLENIFPVLYFVTEGNSLEMQIRNQIVKMDLMRFLKSAVLEISLNMM